MDELEAIIKIFLKAPRAILSGRLELGEEGSVYGLPARLIGILLLPIPVLAVGCAIYQFCFRDSVLPDWFAFVTIVVFFGGVTLAAFLFVVFRQKRRPRNDDDRP
jgi:hypothetical protein